MSAKALLAGHHPNFSLRVMQKLGFSLDVEDGWPPVAVEHVWCERIGSAYELKNAPFFIHGLAIGDRFTAEPDPTNGCVFEFHVIECAGHSLVWVLDSGDLKFDNYKQNLLKLGCSVESLPAFGLHAIDVPPAVEPRVAVETLDWLESLGFALAFPVWRHERSTT